jgi:uncharacterized lipoprotein
MKNVFKPFPLAAGALLAVLLMSGCALTKDYIAVSYVPQSNVSRIQGAEMVKVKVQVVDSRTARDRVSVKKNGYGMEMAPILATNDVAGVLKNAIEAELTTRGFSLAGNSVIVQADLSKFYSDFKVGFWSGSAVAELTMHVQVKHADGSIAFTRIVTAGGINPSLQIASGSNAKVALEAALKNAVAELFSDRGFIDSLLEANRALTQAGNKN